MAGMTSRSCGIWPHDERALDRVQLHELVFLARESRRLAEDAVVDADLADVVEQGGQPTRRAPPRERAPCSARGRGIAGDPFGVAAGVGVLRVDRRHERPHGVDEQLAVRLRRAFELLDRPFDRIGHEVERLGQFRELAHPADLDPLLEAALGDGPHLRHQLDERVREQARRHERDDAGEQQRKDGEEGGGLLHLCDRRVGCRLVLLHDQRRVGIVASVPRTRRAVLPSPRMYDFVIRTGCAMNSLTRSRWWRSFERKAEVSLDRMSVPDRSTT